MNRMIIVDDEPENNTLVEKIIRKDLIGVDVVSATSLKDAQEKIRLSYENNNPFDILLSDMIMDTQTDGIDLIEWAVKNYPDIYCILITGNERQIDRLVAYKRGAKEVIEKAALGGSTPYEISQKVKQGFENRKTMESYSFIQRYMDQNVVSMIERDKERVKLKQKTLTVAFWDIRGFSEMCESLKETPLVIAEFIEEYSILASRAIESNKGILDKFMGDGVMGIFGYLAENEDDIDEGAEMATRAGIAFLKDFNELVEKRRPMWIRISPREFSIALGCGIHTGSVLAGEIGSSNRRQFTAIGGHVNLAARVESNSSGNVLVTSSTEIRLPSKIRRTQLENFAKAKGVDGNIRIFAVGNND